MLRYFHLFLNASAQNEDEVLIFANIIGNFFHRLFNTTIRIVIHPPVVE